MNSTCLALCCALLAAPLTACESVRNAVGSVFQPDLRAEMSDSDVDLAVATMQASLESDPNGTASSWSNPETGNRGSITPLETFQTDEGYYCREFEEALSVGGRSGSYDNAACRDDDGTWRLVDL